MLIGKFEHGVDPKGRLFVPAKWRDDLGATIIVTHGILSHDNVRCLFGMSVDNWRRFSERFMQLPETDVEGQEIRRMLFLNAAECELDKQGRILIPVSLRTHAGINGEAVMVGVDTRIEIWEASALEEHNTCIREHYSATLMQLSARGI